MTNKNTDQSKAGNFWSGKLENFSSPTPFVVDKIIVDNQYQEKSKVVTLESSANSLHTLLKTANISQDAFFSAVWGLILSKYSTEEDVLFGLSVKDLNIKAKQIVPVCVNVNPDLSLNDYLKNLSGGMSEVTNELLIDDDSYHQYSSIPETEALFESIISVTPENKTLDKDVENPGLLINISINKSVDVNVIYNAARFSEKTIERLVGHIEIVTQAFVSDTSTLIKNICLLNDDEKELVLKIWNETQVNYPDDKCLHHLFEQQVCENGSNTAVIFEDTSLSYSELNALSNQLANYLINKGAAPGKLIAISLNRGLNMVVAMMAVSKSGAAYVPLDPKYPSDRLGFMLEDTNAPILITESSLVDDFPPYNAEPVLIDTDWSAIAKQSDSNPDSTVTCKDLAYVIYTSGSTGRPKGAVLNHQGRVNNFCDFNRRYNIAAGDVLLGLASISFDMSAYDVFGTLACGGCLVVADATNIQGASNWSQLMVKHDITIWHSVPALLEMLVDHVEERPELVPHKLRVVLLGGDWIPVALPDRLKALVSTVQVVSMGGATECSMDSTIYDINKPSSNWKSIPYGFPMANQLTYILDTNLQPVPIGVAGELHLGGVGVGEGYLNREELTSEKFITNPFREGERIYKTGDLARFGEDGNLELLGRIDFQVKIRGFRIELGEIESCLRQHSAVKECVILAKLDANNEKRLVAYVLPDDSYEDSDVDETEEEQVEQWQSVYDSAYSKAENLEDETFNIVSWDSSYTSEAYPEEVMRTWVNSTVERIKKHKPDTVLEIGCGTGLLLLRVAPSCKLYTGTDISQVALEHVATQKEKLDLPQVELLKVSGEDFSEIKNKDYGAAVLNSIVMDFPNIDYLTEVISGATKLIKSGGIFFIGDVRDQNTLQAFHTSVQVHRSRSSSDIAELKQVINRQVNVEEEMLIDPAYFMLLKEQIPEVTDVCIHYKRGKNNNEMTKFRYDVTLFIGDNEVESISNWHNWDSDNDNLDTIRNLLTQIKNSPVAIRHIPNIRNAEDYLAIAILAQEEIAEQSVSDLRKTVKQKIKQHAGIDPESLWALADEMGIETEIHYSQDNDPEYFDVVFKPADYNKSIATNINYSHVSEMSECANNPLLSKIRRKVVTKLRHHLDNHLPNYMVPSAFIMMDKFPLSPNGKLNRKALPVPDNLRPELEESYLAPRNDVETVLSDIWAQCLNLEQVGVKDGFIALGGNSLTATQVVSRIRDLFQVDLPISYGFNSSIGELAQQLEDTGRENGVDVMETANVYLQVSSMSENEIENMLN